MQEQDLIIGLKNGDQEMFKKMIEHYQVPLVRLCKGFLHNEEDARDIVQETFIETYESIHSFRADAKFSTWIYRIAVNKSLNLLRKNKLHRMLVNLDFLLLQQNNSNDQLLPDINSDQPDAHIEQREKMQQIRRAVDSLPDSQRIAFILNKYQHLTYIEITEVMDISLSSVESLIHRAKINLQKKLYRLYKKNLL